MQSATSTAKILFQSALKFAENDFSKFSTEQVLIGTAIPMFILFQFGIFGRIMTTFVGLAYPAYMCYLLLRVGDTNPNYSKQATK